MCFKKYWKVSKIEFKKCSSWWERFVLVNLKFCSSHNFYILYSLLELLNSMQNKKIHWLSVLGGDGQPHPVGLDSLSGNALFPFWQNFIAINIFQIFKERCLDPFDSSLVWDIARPLYAEFTINVCKLKIRENSWALHIHVICILGIFMEPPRVKCTVWMP